MSSARQLSDSLLTEHFIKIQIKHNRRSPEPGSGFTEARSVCVSGCERNKPRAGVLFNTNIRARLWEAKLEADGSGTGMDEKTVAYRRKLNKLSKVAWSLNYLKWLVCVAAMSAWRSHVRVCVCLCGSVYLYAVFDAICNIYRSGFTIQNMYVYLKNTNEV